VIIVLIQEIQLYCYPYQALQSLSTTTASFKLEPWWPYCRNRSFVISVLSGYWLNYTGKAKNYSKWSCPLTIICMHQNHQLFSQFPSTISLMSNLHHSRYESGSRSIKVPSIKQFWNHFDNEPNVNFYGIES